MATYDDYIKALNGEHEKDHVCYWTCDYCGATAMMATMYATPKDWIRFVYSSTNHKDACPACRSRAQQEYDEWIDEVWTDPTISSGTYGQIPGR